MTATDTLTTGGPLTRRGPSGSPLQRGGRIGSLTLGCGLLAWGLARRSAAGVSATAIAVPLVYAGLMGRRPWPLTGPRDTREALGGPKGVHIRESVRVARPIEEAFAEWRRLETLPALMPGLERVAAKGGTRSHWVARGPAGLPVEWDAEVINEEQDRLIAWRTLPGSDVQSAGSVRFDPTTDGTGTKVSVHLQYAGPGGRVSAALARLAGRDPARQVRRALRRFKQALEEGAGPR